MSTAPFLLGAKGRAAPHTPVWFMRQAGRSLPEYRALRGEGSILDAIKQPDLAAEITLQPVRRYGVDAAVLYSDIVVPAHAVGFGIDVAPGHRPGRRPRRCAAPPTSTACARSSPSADTPYVARDRRAAGRRAADDVPLLAFAGAPFTVASYLIEGRPSRDLRAHQAADAHRRGAVARADGPARPTSPWPRSPASSTPGPRLPAVRLVGRRAVEPRRLRAVRPAPLAGGSSPSSPPATRTRPASTSASAATTCSSRCTPAGPSVHRPRLAHRASPTPARRLGADLVVQGNLDPALVLAGARRALAAHRRRARRQRPATRVTSSTSATACSPSTDPGVLGAIVDQVHERTAR